MLKTNRAKGSNCIPGNCLGFFPEYSNQSFNRGFIKRRSLNVAFLVKEDA